MDELTYAGYTVGIREDEDTALTGLTMFELGPCVISLEIDTDDGDYEWEVVDTLTGVKNYYSSLAEALKSARETAIEADNDADDEVTE